MASKAVIQSLRDQEKILQEQIELFKSVQKEIQKCATTKGQLDTQLNENKAVKEELDLMEDDAVVYKLIGPVLVKQELGEARQNVDKRLEYISKEIERCEESIKELETKHETLAEKLNKLQQDYQQTMIKAGILR